MPIQMWTPDTTSQSSWQGTQALANGISGGVKSLADSIGAAAEQRKQENVRAKASETLFKSTPELQDALGMDEEQFKGLSSAEKNELVRGGLGKMSLMESLANERQRREAFNAQQMDSSRRQADELGFNRAVREQMQINPQSPELGNFYENPEQYPQGRPTSRQPGLMEVLGAAAQHNQLGSPQLDNLLNSLSRAQPKEPVMVPPGLEPSSFTHNGLTFTRPTAEKPAKVVAPNFPWLFDDDKEVFKRGIMTLEPAERDAALAARGAYNRSIGRDDPLREALAQILSGGKTPDKKAEPAKPGPARWTFDPKTRKLVQ